MGNKSSPECWKQDFQFKIYDESIHSNAKIAQRSAFQKKLRRNPPATPAIKISRLSGFG